MWFLKPCLYTIWIFQKPWRNQGLAVLRNEKVTAKASNGDVILCSKTTQIFCYSNTKAYLSDIWFISWSLQSLHPGLYRIRNLSSIKVSVWIVVGFWILLSMSTFVMIVWKFKTTDGFMKITVSIHQDSATTSGKTKEKTRATKITETMQDATKPHGTRQSDLERR